MVGRLPSVIQSAPERCLTLMHPDGEKAKVVMQQTADDVDQAKRSSSFSLIGFDVAILFILSGSQMRESLRKWLSPPDPSTNHNLACSNHLEGTSAWFLRSSAFKEWKSEGPLLWIHGKREFISCLLSGT